MASKTPEAAGSEGDTFPLGLQPKTNGTAGAATTCTLLILAGFDVVRFPIPENKLTGTGGARKEKSPGAGEGTCAGSIGKAPMPANKLRERSGGAKEKSPDDGAGAGVGAGENGLCIASVVDVACDGVQGVHGNGGVFGEEEPHTKSGVAGQ